MKFRRDGRQPRGLAIGATGTVVVHGLFVALLLWTSRAQAGRAPTVYSVELVAAPLPTSTRRPAPAATPTPPAPPKVDPKPTPKKAPPAKKTPTPKTVDPKTEPAPPTKTANQPVPGATPSTGTDVDNVNLKGVDFPFPDYLRNLMNEILRRWARPAGTGALEAEVSFTIMRDGTVRDIKVVRSSRSYSFDLEAQGAVEQAAEDKAFGPLPRGWTSDILQVAFLFTPRKRP
ncbi:MAG: TonB family protein [Gemmatimonadales bacterium]|nr:TonB family protein [Gemmatimonadales bacterium]